MGTDARGGIMSNDFKVGDRVRLTNWRDNYWIEVTAIGRRAFLGVPNQAEQMRVLKTYDPSREISYDLRFGWVTIYSEIQRGPSDI